MKNLIPKFLRRKPRWRIRMYMKSGNVITLDGVTELEITNKGDDISGIKLRHPEKKGREKLFISSIALSQIEAVTTEPM